MGVKNEAELGSALTLIRSQRGLSQSELAKQCGVSQRTISLLENGKSGNISTLIKVLRALKIEIELRKIISEIKLTDYIG